MLKISNLFKSYAKSNIFAVNDLSLELRPGEIFGFLGPNGAGKTTTIKAVTGILSFDSGIIEVCGHNIVYDSKAAKMNFGYVSDSHILFEKLTGREYVNFLADVYGVSLEDRTERASRMLEMFNLTSAYDSQISTYSHGMKQKINIIGAMIHNPKLWILDEPLTGLDPQSAFQLKTLMRQHCDNGNTVFFSTHVLEVAEKLCDRIGVVANGRLVMVGSMKDIREASTDKSLEEIFLKLLSDNSTFIDPASPINPNAANMPYPQTPNMPNHQVPNMPYPQAFDMTNQQANNAANGQANNQINHAANQQANNTSSDQAFDMTNQQADNTSSEQADDAAGDQANSDGGKE